MVVVGDEAQVEAVMVGMDVALVVEFGSVSAMTAGLVEGRLVDILVGMSVMVGGRRTVVLGNEL